MEPLGGYNLARKALPKNALVMKRFAGVDNENFFAICSVKGAIK